MFVTMAAGIYDANSGAVRLANAGHEPPLVHARDGSFADFPAQAPPLGILPGTAFPEDDVELAGGSLYLCSDGLTEAEAEPGNALGAAGLRRLVAQYREQALAERIEAIGADVSAMDTRDDLTLLGVSDEAER